MLVPMCSGASWNWKQRLKAVHHNVVSSADTKRDQPGVNLGSTCTSLPMEAQSVSVSQRVAGDSMLHAAPSQQGLALVHFSAQPQPFLSQNF